MTKTTTQFYRAKLFSFSLKENEYIGRLQFLGFNLVAIIILLIAYASVRATALKYNDHAFDEPYTLDRILMSGILVLPYLFYLFRTIVLRLKDIFPKTKQSKIVIISLLWLILSQGLNIASKIVDRFEYTSEFNIYDLPLILVLFPMLILLIFMGGREKPQPE